MILYFSMSLNKLLTLKNLSINEHLLDLKNIINKVFIKILFLIKTLIIDRQK